MYLSTDNRHTYAYKLCSSSNRLVYLFAFDFIQGLFKKNEKKLPRSFNFTFRYIDDVLSLNNSKLGDFVDRIYPTELEIKDTTDTATSASYLDLQHIDVDSAGRLWMKLYDKRDDLNFPIVNFPFICSIQQLLNMKYISLSWYDIPEFVVHIIISVIEACC